MFANRKKSLEIFVVGAGINVLGKKRQNKKRLSTIMGSAITLENNEAKDIIKIIRSLENRGNSLERTTRKIVQRKDYLVFLLH